MASTSLIYNLAYHNEMIYKEICLLIIMALITKLHLGFNIYSGIPRVTSF